jgi:hypothetical protein
LNESGQSVSHQTRRLHHRKMTEPRQNLERRAEGCGHARTGGRRAALIVLAGEDERRTMQGFRISTRVLGEGIPGDGLDEIAVSRIQAHLASSRGGDGRRQTVAHLLFQKGIE